MKNNEDFIVYGSGSPLRQFIHSQDLARMIIKILDDYKYDETNTIILSVDEDDEISIGNVARLISREFDWESRMVFDDKFSELTTLSNLLLSSVIPMFFLADI